jgi:hypothetical protein
VSLNVVSAYWTLALHGPHAVFHQFLCLTPVNSLGAGGAVRAIRCAPPDVEKQSRQEIRNQRDRSKIQRYGKNERRISRTRTKPVSCKIDVFVPESDQWAASDLEVAPQRFGPVDYYSGTKPGYRCAAKL